MSANESLNFYNFIILHPVCLMMQGFHFLQLCGYSVQVLSV